MHPLTAVHRYPHKLCLFTPAPLVFARRAEPAPADDLDFDLDRLYYLFIEFSVWKKIGAYKQM